jgi:tripartite-type tricarboxylate transporter receptor subunit TctC
MVLRGVLACMLALASMTMFGAGNARALDYPNRYVKLVVPYPPGGSAEAQARTLGDQLAKIWKQPVVIENKPGAGTTIGAASVASADPDGYTLYLASTSHAVTPSMYKSLSYDAVKSFAPISRVSTSPILMLVDPQLGIKTVQDYVELAHKKPGSLTYGSSGIGASPHLSAEMFIHRTGIKVLHVPFRGAAPAVTALLGHHVNSAFVDISGLPQVLSGQLKALAVTSLKRAPELPDVPTMDETVAKGYEVTNWSMILAPAGTPKEIVDFINASIAKALALPEVKKAYRIQGYETTPSTPEEARAHLVAEVAKYAEVIKNAGIKPQ